MPKSKSKSKKNHLGQEFVQPNSSASVTSGAETSNSIDTKFKNIFVTVGTTSFDRLIELVTKRETLSQMSRWGTEQVKVQIGASKIQKECKLYINGICFTFYRYKSSLAEDMLWADLIICHAGAGTTLDALDAEKIICVIPNDSLMDNHQNELANCIVEKGYGFSTTIEHFCEFAPKISTSVIPFPKSNVLKFLQIIEEDVLRFDPKEVEQAKRKFEDNHKKKMLENAKNKI